MREKPIIELARDLGISESCLRNWVAQADRDEGRRSGWVEHRGARGAAELLDQHHWTSRSHLATAIFEWIECWYNPHRRHSYCDGLSPIDHENAEAA